MQVIFFLKGRGLGVLKSTIFLRMKPHQQFSIRNWIEISLIIWECLHHDKNKTLVSLREEFNNENFKIPHTLASSNRPKAFSKFPRSLLTQYRSCNEEMFD